MSILSNTGIRAGASGAGGVYEIEKSLRFNSDDGAYLNRTQVAGNRKTYTISWWQKFSKTRTNQRIFGTGSSYQHSVMYDGSDRFYFYYSSSNGNGEFTTERSFRDPVGWYHFVFAVDTTQATASNRLKLWVNGVQETEVVSTTYPNQDVDMYWNYAAAHYIGKYAGGYSFEGYMAEVFMTDGTAYDASTFGEEDANGKWIPKDCSADLSYGNNGCYLKFNGTDLGEDSSGENHDWTANEFSLEDGAAVTVASATGAKPIWNTSDDHGQTIGSGTRTDSNSSDLAGAWPLTAANSNALTDDESGNSRTLTAHGSSSSDTNKYKYYGSSCSFTANGYFKVSNSDFTFGTDDFTIECWIYHPNNSTINGSLFSTASNSLSTTTLNSRMYGQAALDVYCNGSSEYITIANPPRDEWFHLALVRSGSTMKVYFNGKLKVTNNYWSANIGTGENGDFYINKGRDGTCARWMQDVRVYAGTAKYSGEFTPPEKSVNNITAGGLDVLKDTPTDFDDDGTGTGTYCTLNPLDNSTNTLLTLTNGNLTTTGASSDYAQVRATMEMTSGKWYWEVTRESGSGAADPRAGVCANSVIMTTTRGGTDSKSWAYLLANGSSYGGKGFNNGAYSGSEDLFSNGDVAMFAYDADAGKLWFGKNGTWAGSGNPAAGSNEFYSSVTAPVIPFVDSYYATTHSNFGQRAFTYTPPTGFKTLNTYNLSDPTIKDPSKHFDTGLNTGANILSTATGLTDGADLVWIKDRDNGSTNHILFNRINDSGMDGTPHLRANEKDDESTTGSYSAPSGNSVAWVWNAGSSNVTNDASATGIGSIDSTYRANTSAGFSVVTYTGNGGIPTTVAHGLNAKPGMIWIKDREQGTKDWIIYHNDYGATKYLTLNIDSNLVDSDAIWSDTEPTSTVWTMRSNSDMNSNGIDYVAYCWSEVEGYSRFGGYTGNSLTNGPYVHCGFTPKWIMIKTAHTGYNGSWVIYDTARTPTNTGENWLYANSAAAEAVAATYAVTVTANGFKVRSGSAENNSNGRNYIYAAFAESPFKYSNAQ